MKTPVATSKSVLDAIAEAPRFAPPACVMLREVRNGTGYAKQVRTADAVVVSVWPSRGVWLGGIEVKVSRSDWLRELKDPTKAAEIQKYCNYWWLASPEGVCEPGELPENW